MIQHNKSRVNCEKQQFLFLTIQSQSAASQVVETFIRVDVYEAMHVAKLSPT